MKYFHTDFWEGHLLLLGVGEISQLVKKNFNKILRDFKLWKITIKDSDPFLLR